MMIQVSSVWTWSFRSVFSQRLWMSSLLAPFVILGFSLPAQALVEIRGSYGFHTINSGDFNSFAESQATGLKGTMMSGFGFDGIVTLPLMPVGLGLRYESLGQKLEAAGVSVEAKSTRISALANMRLLDSVVYLGVLGTIGLSHDNHIKSSIGGLDYKAGSTTSFSIAGEAGTSVLGMIAGGELGYMYMVSKDLAKGDGAKLANDPSLNLGGLYIKLMLGIGF